MADTETGSDGSHGTTEQKRGQTTGGPMLEMGIIISAVASVYIGTKAEGILGGIAGLAFVATVLTGVWWIVSGTSEGDSHD